jgi:hypothetical protein
VSLRCLRAAARWPGDLLELRFRQQSRGGKPVFPGQRVLLDRFAYVLRQPERWDVVAFDDPAAPRQLAVKRILGLPGERIEFRQGDLVADGRVVRKSLAQLRSMAVLVHDHDHQPQPDSNLPPRWQSHSATSGWQTAGGQLLYASAANRTEAFDWMVYHHWPCFAGPGSRTGPAPILDNDSYNQQLSRRLHPVSDVMLACRVRTPGRSGCLALEISGPTGCHRVELCFDRRQLAWFQEARPRSRMPLPRFDYARGVSIELAVCDGQLLLGMDGHELLREPIDDGGRWTADADAEADDEIVGRSASHRVVAIGATGLTLAIDRLRVLRDIHYLPAEPRFGRPTPPQPLGADEVFVVGDNVPLSHDSRHWPSQGLAIERIRGRVWFSVFRHSAAGRP